MLIVSSCRPAPRACARLIGLAACAWMAWLPAHAAEATPADQVAAPPFRQYQGWRDEPLQDWLEANRRVGEIGGWRTYLREAPPGGNVEVTVRKPAGHAGHH